MAQGGTGLRQKTARFRGLIGCHHLGAPGGPPLLGHRFVNKDRSPEKSDPTNRGPPEFRLLCNKVAPYIPGAVLFKRRLTRIARGYLHSIFLRFADLATTAELPRLAGTVAGAGVVVRAQWTPGPVGATGG